MSDDIGHDETILGTALARAVASQPIRATPFERSRIALRMAGGGRSVLAPLLAAAAAIVLGLTLGATLLGQRGSDTGGPATQPSPTATPGASPTSVPSPTATALPNEPMWVYFGRDELPPTGAYVRGAWDATSAATRILSRLNALRAAPEQGPNRGTNSVRLIGRDGWVGAFVQGDLATVEFAPGQFDQIRGASMSGDVITQLVYTITEEPGIRRVQLKERGKNELEIDQAVLDEPLTREAVLPYQSINPGMKTEERIALEDDPRPATATTRIDDSVPGFTRFVIDLKADQPPSEGFWSPQLVAELRQNDLTGNGLERAKSVLQVAVGGARTTFDGYRQVQDGIGIQDVDRSPLRFVRLIQRGPAATGVAWELGLEDGRPWRVALEPASNAGTMRLIVEIGGHPQAVSESISVVSPGPGTDVARTFTVTGMARAFEAHVAWRLKDSREREVASGFVVASLGTSPAWGTFTTEVKVPDGVSGVVTLEVFWPSPRDGSDVGTVAIPLRVR